MVAEIPFVTPLAYPFDHLLVCDGELLAGIQQGGQDSSPGVCVDNCSCS